MIRRLKRDVLAELPPKIRQIVSLPLNGAAGLVDAENKAWAAHESTLASLREAVDAAAVELLIAETSGESAAAAQEVYKAAVAKLNDQFKLAFQTMSKIRCELAVAKAPKVAEYVLSAPGVHREGGGVRSP